MGEGHRFVSWVQGKIETTLPAHVPLDEVPQNDDDEKQHQEATKKHSEGDLEAGEDEFSVRKPLIVRTFEKLVLSPCCVAGSSIFLFALMSFEKSTPHSYHEPFCA